MVKSWLLQSSDQIDKKYHSMKLFIDDLSKEKVELTDKVNNKIILFKLLTNRIDYLHDKYEPKISGNKGDFKLSCGLNNCSSIN